MRAHVLVLALAAIATTGGAQAFAADAGEAVVVVTGLRREEPLAGLAGNTALVSRSEIDALKAQHPSEILNRQPGVLIHRGSGQEHLTSIRSPVLTGGAGAGSFLFLEDGIPLRAAGFANVNGLFEAHTELAGAIEVIRGPGSALYGSNAVHGLINVITRGAGTDDPRFLDVTGGSYERVRGRLFLSRGEAANGAALGLTIAHEGGYRAASGFDQQKLSLRLDRTDGDVKHRFTLSATNLAQETAGFVVGPDAYDTVALARSNANPEAYRDGRSLRAAWRADIARDGGKTLSLTAYARRSDLEFLQHFFPSKALEENEDWSLGLLANHEWTLPGGHEIILGTDIEYTEGSLLELQRLSTIGTYPQGVHYDYDIAALVIAPYLHTQFDLTDRARLTLGARAEWTSYDYDSATPADTVGRFKRPADRQDEYFSLTPKAALSYRLREDLYAYGRFARGARAPQTSDAYRLQSLQVEGDIKEVEIDSLEAGLRHSAERLSIEVAAYHMEKRNFFFRDADGFNVPDGKTRHQGIEIDIDGDVTRALQVSGALSFAEHTYRFSRPVSSSTSEDISSGDFVDTAPRWLWFAEARYRPFEGGASPWSELSLALSWSHVGRYYTDAANDHDYPGHDVFDVRASWDLPGGLTLHASVRNLTNTGYADRADFAFGTERYFPGEIRSFEAGLTARF